MPLNKSKGNMYNFVTHTWNPIKGICSHDCVYCYMKQFKQKPVRLDEKDLKTDLGEDNFIFVGSGTDIWAKDIPKDWIARVLIHCFNYPDNIYLFQSKNPKRFMEFKIPKKHILGTTIESDTYYNIYSGSNVEPPLSRATTMAYHSFNGHKTMITIEPILNFNRLFVELIKNAKPTWVNIGADSKRHNLPEPSWEKVQELITELKKFTEVKCKSNLNRLKEKKACPYCEKKFIPAGQPS